jgi:long-chain acyl-CoA synthetase
MTQIAPGLTSASGARTVAQLPAVAAERYADRVALRAKGADGAWHDTTYAEAGTVIEELALGLVALGIQPGERVAILMNTRAEWTLASYAISAAGAVVVPVYPTNSPEECEWVVGNSGAVAVVSEDAGQLQKIEQVRGALPDLRHTIGIDESGGGITFDDLRARGRDRGDRVELERRQQAVELDDAYTFIYTSGTTGPPKGCVLTHRNAMSVGAMVKELGFLQDDEVAYLYLPLAHSFALTVHLGSFDVGTTIVFFGGDTKQVIAELRETHPTYLPSVPRIFEKLYAMATAAMAQAPPEERERFEQAVRVGVEVRLRRRDGKDVPPELEQGFAAAEERLYKPVRELFGGQVRQAVSGAAPIAPEILEFFYACGVPVLEGWGMTETTALGAVATLDHFKFGTVGRALPGVEIRIAEEDGEVLVRGPQIFREYWGNPEATAETFTDDGWLRTGDLGELDDEGYLKITGRKKDIIITAGGKNLTPANIENDLKQSRWVSQAVMHGDRRPYPVALVTLDVEEVVPWAQGEGLPTDLAALAAHERVRELIQAELDRANAKYAQVEQVKRFVILDHDLTQESGVLTPTLKVKRSVVERRYAEVFEGLYRG